jgi:hypothetical protein
MPRRSKGVHVDDAADEAAVAADEERARAHASPSAELCCLRLIFQAKSSPPRGAEMARGCQRRVQSGQVELINARGKFEDDRLVVIVDRKCRVAAVGWPHQALCFVVERMVGNRVLVHQHAVCLLNEGIWAAAMSVAKVNGADAWGSAPDVTVTRLFHTMSRVCKVDREGDREGAARLAAAQAARLASLAEAAMARA